MNLISSVFLGFALQSLAQGKESLQKILKRQNYDRNLRPFIDDGIPVTVITQIYIVKLSEFRTDRFSYEIQYLLREV